MILYITIGIIVAIIFIILLFKMQSYSFVAKILRQELNDKELQYQQANLNYLAEKDQKISLEKEIISLQHQLAQARGNIEQWHKTKEETMLHAKAALFEVTQQISSKLIDDHKRETKNANEHSKIQIDETKTKLDQQFANLVNIVSNLNVKVKESYDSVDLVKQALLSPTGAGALAEITLENILKASGLVPELDFIMQYHINNSLTNTRLRPDAVVFLPADNVMIIDSKASKFFTQLAQDIDNKELAGKLKTSMRQHLKELAAKDYKEAVRASLDKNHIKSISSIMFLPSEMALEKLQYIDHEFMQKAWELNIFPAGPISIINILSHAKFMIDSEKQLNNHNVIVQEVRKLLQSLNVVFEHIKKVGSHLQSAANNYDKLAGSFNSNIIPKARNMQKLGINLPQNKSFTSPLERYQMVFSHDVIIEAEDMVADAAQVLEKTL